jgi:hypothetical protein
MTNTRFEINVSKDSKFNMTCHLMTKPDETFDYLSIYLETRSKEWYNDTHETRIMAFSLEDAKNIALNMQRISSCILHEIMLIEKAQTNKVTQ